MSGTSLLQAQAEEALGELVAWGLVSADSFSGLRALLIPSDRRRSAVRRRRRTAAFGVEDAGRWSLLRRLATNSLSLREARRGSRDCPVDSRAVERVREVFARPGGNRGVRESKENLTLPHPDLLPEGEGTRNPLPGNLETTEYVARGLLRRYGVVFRRLLEREPEWLPPWYELLKVYRRLEARGEIRGGRFVAGFAGEQYALPEAVGALRAVRKKSRNGALVSVSAADPLNLLGILTPGGRVPALTGNRVLYRDGAPVAIHVGGETRFFEKLEPDAEWTARNALLRQRIPPGLRALRQ